MLGYGGDFCGFVGLGGMKGKFGGGKGGFG